MTRSRPCFGSTRRSRTTWSRAALISPTSAGQIAEPAEIFKKRRKQA
jgi:hypothetical protein